MPVADNGPGGRRREGEPAKNEEALGFDDLNRGVARGSIGPAEGGPTAGTKLDPGPGSKPPSHAVAFRDRRPHFCDLKVTLTSLFSSCDGTHLAIEWLWEVTRRSDGERSTTRDAIIADLSGGRIKPGASTLTPPRK